MPNDEIMFAKLRHVFAHEDGLNEADALRYYSDDKLNLAREADPQTFKSWEERYSSVAVFNPKRT